MPAPRDGDARVAQLVEHVTENHGVGGSTPSPGTIASPAYPRRSLYKPRNSGIFAHVLARIHPPALS